jgi:hypothetical protein
LFIRVDVEIADRVMDQLEGLANLETIVVRKKTAHTVPGSSSSNMVVGLLEVQVGCFALLRQQQPQHRHMCCSSAKVTLRL